MDSPLRDHHCDFGVTHLDYGVTPGLRELCLSCTCFCSLAVVAQTHGLAQPRTMPKEQSAVVDGGGTQTQTLLEATRWPAVVAEAGLAQGHDSCILRQARTFDVRSNCTGLATWEWSLLVLQHWLRGPRFHSVQACDKAPEVAGDNESNT